MSLSCHGDTSCLDMVIQWHPNLCGVHNVNPWDRRSSRKGFNSLLICSCILSELVISYECIYAFTVPETRQRTIIQKKNLMPQSLSSWEDHPLESLASPIDCLYFTLVSLDVASAFLFMSAPFWLLFCSAISYSSHDKCNPLKQHEYGTKRSIANFYGQ